MNQAIRLKEIDVLVVGAGVAGLSAATAAAWSEKSVALIEKSDVIGGTACYANGSIWIPNNCLATTKGIRHDPEREIRFILDECWDSFDETKPHCGVGRDTYERVERYVSIGHKVIDDLMREQIHSFTQLEGIFKSYFFGAKDSLECAKTALASKIFPANEDLQRAACSSWDYHWENKYNAVPYGKHVWASIDLFATSAFLCRGLRRHFWHILRNLASIRTTASLLDQLPKLFAKFWGFGHGLILVERFRRHLKRKNVPLLTGIELVTVHAANYRVDSVEVKTRDGKLSTWKINEALILASGCFSHSLYDPQRNGSFPIHSACVAATNRGDAIRVLKSADVQVDRNPRPLLAQTVLPLAMQERGVCHEPVFFLYGDSFFVVDRHGRRVMNEKLNYHDRAQHHLDDPEREFLFLIGDRRFKERNWGFGISLPFDQKFILHGKTEIELQRKIDQQLSANRCRFKLSEEFALNLCATKTAFNNYARAGDDPEFGRGKNAYDVLGFPKPDRDHDSPSRTMQPLSGDDLYASVYALSAFSTHGGLVCDVDSRVLDSAGNPWQNLYAVGTCAASFLNGRYPSHGMSIGIGLVFGYLAGLHATASLERLSG